MKKILLLLFAITIVGTISAQDWGHYLKFNIGTGYLSDASFDDTPLLTIDVGNTYKWVDLVASVDYINYSSGYVELSINFKPKIDIMKTFTKETKHSVKVGTGLGIGIKSDKIYGWGDTPSVVEEDAKTNWFYKNSVMLSYEYQVCNKTWVGAFFEDYITDVFFGKYYAGLSVRLDF